MSNVPDAILTLLAQIHEDIQAINTRLADHIEEEEGMLRQHAEQIESMERDVISLRSAIPGEDMLGHQLYHTSVIKRNEFLADMFKEAAKHIAKYGLMAFLLWLIWHGFEDVVKNVTSASK